MNKFLTIFALVVVVAGCSAMDEAQREREVGHLTGEQKLFEDFCLNQSEYIRADIRQRSNDMSASIFEVFFGNAADIANEVVELNRRTTREFAQTIQNPNQELEDTAASDDNIGQSISEGKQNIANTEGVFGRMLVAGRHQGRTLLEPVKSAFSKKVDQFRMLANPRTFIDGLVAACRQVYGYERILGDNLDAEKRQLKSASNEGEVQSSIDSVSVANLQCFTTQGVTRLSGFCQLFENGFEPALKMFGIDANFKMSDSEGPIPARQVAM